MPSALVKLSSAMHSLARTKTAGDILEAIAVGERDPEKLAALDHVTLLGRSVAAVKDETGAALDAIGEA